ncbi:hypothetical protein P7C73_g6560, partial [Tremellales sp. Uapishka_1]
MTISFSKPSRSYLDVQRDENGLPGVAMRSSASSASGRQRPIKEGFKTYRPSLVETHLKRPVMHDNHPESAFSPLPSIMPHKRKEQSLAGQKAELDHILSSGFKSASMHGDDDPPFIAAGGPSSRSRSSLGGLRHSASQQSFMSKPVGMGIYMDAKGKAHDTEFDPFAGVTDISRRKTRRRSAFGSNHRKRSSDSETSSADSGSEKGVRSGRVSHESHRPGREEENDREQEEIRRRLELERRRLDEVSGYAAARRRSMMSERSGRNTPSIRSEEDGPHSANSIHLDRTLRSRSSQGYFPSPLSPTFGEKTSSSSYTTTRTLPTTIENEESPAKVTEGGAEDRKIRGFQVATPSLPVPPTPSLHVPSTPSHLTGRVSPASRKSSETNREYRPKPVERPREELFPETPAQIKKREDRERRTGHGHVGSHRTNHLMVDTAVSRVLPEIEIVQDDDPRIVFPANGPSTKIQTVHDHVIRRPFAETDKPASFRSFEMGRAPSTIIDQGQGGYLPSRWASGDRKLRKTEEEKEQYRPREWRNEDDDEVWKPGTKEMIKRNWKDITTATRFSLFRTKKALQRKV